MTPQEAYDKALEWDHEAGGRILPLLTANELAGIVNEETNRLTSIIASLEAEIDVLKRFAEQHGY